MKTTVIHVRDMKPGDVYIGRNPAHRQRNHDPHVYFGNPFRIGDHGDRATVIKLFKTYFAYVVKNDPGYRAEVLNLKGHRLACHCAPLPCHGDVIAEWLEKQGEK